MTIPAFASRDCSTWLRETLPAQDTRAHGSDQSEPGKRFSDGILLKILQSEEFRLVGALLESLEKLLLGLGDAGHGLA